MPSPRFDLTPDPAAAGATIVTADGALVGPFGGGLALLHSERFRFIVGHDLRRVGDRFERHPLGRAFVTGRKCIPWMHHPYVPHAILERDDDRCEWLMVMGTFGPSHDWGDGTEANFPQYGIRKSAKDRRELLWEDGVALELVLVDAGGRERRLADFDWQIRHRPGLLELLPVDADAVAPVGRIELAAPGGERCGRVRITWASGATGGTLQARARFLAKQLTVAPSEHRGAIDVLDAPFGFQKFTDHPLTPRALAGGVAFDVPALGVALFFAADGKAHGRYAAVDPLAREPQELPAGAPQPSVPAPCFDVVLELAIDGAGGTSDLAFGVVDDRDPARTVATALRAPLGGEREGLTLETGDRGLDAMLRWSLDVAHALVAPNGVVMTGALGYSAKCHVGQDVPFVLPLFLLDPHPRLRAAARRMLEIVVASPSGHPIDEADGRGILDHPCEGQDFAFLPMRPRTARIFRPIGAAGLFRWLLVLEHYLAATGDRALARRAFELFAGKVERHYLPFAFAHPCWSAGEETQEPAYSLPTAYDGLAALLRLAETLDPACAARLRAPIADSRAAIRAQIEQPVAAGGLRLAAPLARGGVTLAAGWIVQRWVLEKEPPWFGFDLPLVAAHALLHGALSADHEARLADLLADPTGSFRVAGAGLAKSPGGEKGVWFWHNALAAKGLARAGRIDAAHALFVDLARGIADVNGLGVPGEESNGGDYAMGIGALAGLALVESLLGLEVRGERVTIRPALPSALEHVVVADLTLRERSYRVEITRRRAGPLVAAEALELGATTPATVAVALG